MQIRRVFRWIAWIFSGLFGVACIGFAALALYFGVIAPAQDRAKAAAFTRLSGPARRVAIFDEAARQIEAHYYDQRFAGMNWPAVKAEYRRKSANAADDFELYGTVFMALSEAFPVSHMSFGMPNTLTASPEPIPPQSRPKISCDFLSPFPLAVIRRGKKIIGVVGEVAPHSPESQAGLLPGDIITQGQSSQHDNQNIADFTLTTFTPTQIRTLELTGSLSAADQKVPAPSLHTLHIVQPCRSPPPSFESHRVSEGPLYIRFDAFQKPEVEQVAAALRTADSRGVVLDLRANHGGYPELLLDLLMPRGAALYRWQCAGRFLTLLAKTEGAYYTGKLAVLIGPASASAAEISAWILHSYRNAVLVGRPTSGSVLGKHDYPLPDGGMVSVATQDTEMLDGTHLEGIGVAPDITIYPTLQQLRHGEDAALEAAIHALQTRSR